MIYINRKRTIHTYLTLCRGSKLAFLHRVKERKTPSLSAQASIAPFSLKVVWSGKSLIKIDSTILVSVPSSLIVTVTYWTLFSWIGPPFIKKTHLLKPTQIVLFFPIIFEKKLQYSYLILVSCQCLVKDISSSVLPLKLYSSN